MTTTPTGKAAAKAAVPAATQVATAAKSKESTPAKTQLAADQGEVKRKSVTFADSTSARRSKRARQSKVVTSPDGRKSRTTGRAR
jgi:hypothetical protein